MNMIKRMMHEIAHRRIQHKNLQMCKIIASSMNPLDAKEATFLLKGYGRHV